MTKMFFRNTYPALLWALFIAVLCGMPGKDIPHISVLEIFQFDKFVHAFMFFILLILLVKDFSKTNSPIIFRQNNFLIAIIFCITYGGLLEILQGLVFVDRSADVLDFIANSFGCLLAVLLLKKGFLKFLHISLE